METNVQSKSQKPLPPSSPQYSSQLQSQFFYHEDQSISQDDNKNYNNNKDEYADEDYEDADQDNDEKSSSSSSLFVNEITSQKTLYTIHNNLIDDIKRSIEFIKNQKNQLKEKEEQFQQQQQKLLLLKNEKEENIEKEEQQQQEEGEEEKEEKEEKEIKKEKEEKLNEYIEKYNILFRLYKEIKDKEEDFINENNSINEEMKQIRKKIESYQNELMERSTVINTQEECINNLKVEVFHLIEDIDERDKTNTILKNDLDMLEKRYDQLADDYDMLTEHSKKEKEKSMISFEENRKQLEQKLKDQLELHLKVSNQFSTLQDECQSYQHQCQQLQSEVSIEQEKVRQLNFVKDQIVESKKLLSIERDNISRLQNEKDDLLDELSISKERIQEQDQEIDLLLKEKTDAQIQLVPLKSSLSLLESLKSDYSQLKQLFNEKVEVYEQLNQKYNEKKSQLIGLQKSNDQLEQRFKELDEKFESKETEFNNLQFNFKQSTEQLKKKEKSFETTKLELMELLRINQEYKQRIESLESNQSQQTCANRDRETLLNQKVMEAKDTLLSTMRDLNDEKLKSNSASEELDRAQRKIDTITKDNEKLRQMLEVLKVYKDTSDNTSTKDAELRKTKKEVEYYLSVIEQKVKLINEKDDLIKLLQNSNINTIDSFSSINIQNKLSQQQQSSSSTSSSSPKEEQQQQKQQELQQQQQTIKKRSFDEITLPTSIKRSKSDNQSSSPSSTTTVNNNNNKSVSNNKEFSPPTPSIQPTIPNIPSGTISISTNNNNNNKNNNNNSNTSKEYVICLTGFNDKDDKQSITSAIEFLGGKIKNTDFDASITHIVTNSPAPTMKTISAVLTQKWLISPLWIFESKKKGYFLPEENYGQIFHQKPFHGKTFYLTESFINSQKVKESSVYTLICSIGRGKITKDESLADYVLISNDFKTNKDQTNYLTWSQFLAMVPTPSLKF
ncbi:hypothetical protein ACTFIR_002173 [Dictyostelium discoideum]